jgi:tetratricopeptide (TPR) repeat protein
MIGLLVLLMQSIPVQPTPVQPAPVQPARVPSTPQFEAVARAAAAARDSSSFDEAVKLYKKALELEPDWDEGWWNLGSIQYDRDKFAECTPAFERLAALKPDAALSWTMAGLCEYRLRDFDAALRSLLAAERLGFREPEELSRAARLHLAIVLTKSGSFEKAITTLTELTRIDRATPELMAVAGIAGIRRPWLPSEVPEAERDKVIKLGEAMGAGMELDSSGAVERFEIVVKAYPEDPDIHFRFGAFLMKQAPERGIEEIKRALALDPKHIPALVGLAMIYLRNGDPSNARSFGEKAVETSPGDFAAHIALGRALLESDDPAAAAVELAIAVKLAPDSPDAHFSLASAYSRLGRREDAAKEQKEFRRLRKLTDSAHQ